MPRRRREFLQWAAAAGLASACDAEAEARAAQGPLEVSGKLITPPSGAELPKLQLGRFLVSRLIIGANPFHGYSHFNRILSNHMMEWADRDRVCEILARCERLGINTWQFSHHARGMGDLERYRQLGGTIQWIVLSHRELEEDPALVRQVAKLGPIGIVHHGGSAERKRRAGQTAQIRDFLKRVRDAGVLAGLSTHDPAFLEQAEEENWETDFYMASLYYLTRTPEEFRKILGTRPIGEIYLPEDPPRMCEAIRKTKKVCLVYKVLAAGRLVDSPKQIDEAFEFVLRNTKPNDGMIIGMYPRFSDQITENVERFRRISAALGS